MPLKNTLGSFKSLSISEGYVVPDAYWLLNWEYEDTGAYYGSFTGSYFTTEGKLWLGAIYENVLDVIEIDDYGRFNNAQKITLPTTYTVNANAYYNYSYTGLYNSTTISGNDSTPISVTRLDETFYRYTTLPLPHWVTTNSNVIYVQNIDGTGTMLPHGSSLNNNWLPQNFSAYANGYMFSGHSDYIYNGLNYTDLLFNYTSTGNVRYVDYFGYSGTAEVSQTDIKAVLPQDNNESFISIYTHGVVTISPYVTYSYGLFVKLSSAGLLSYAKSLTVSSNPLILGSIVVIDSDYYAIGTANSSVYIVKGSISTGTVSLAKQLTGVTSAIIKTSKLNPSELFVSCNSGRIAKFDLNLNLQYQRQLSQSFSLRVDGVGSMYLIGTYFVFKTPSDGSILQYGEYSLGDLTLTYSSVSSIGTANVTVTSTTFTNLSVTKSTSFIGSYTLPCTIEGTVLDVQKTSWNT